MVVLCRILFYLYVYIFKTAAIGKGMIYNRNMYIKLSLITKTVFYTAKIAILMKIKKPYAIMKNR